MDGRVLKREDSHRIQLLICRITDADFAIVDEAYPYVAQRLLCDDSPRLQDALRYMVRIASHNHRMPFQCWRIV